jgi:hypothetical protein
MLSTSLLPAHHISISSALLLMMQLACQPWSGGSSRQEDGIQQHPLPPLTLREPVLVLINVNNGVNYP